MEIPTIPCVEVTDMPDDVRDYLIDEGVDTHGQNDVIAIDDDGNVFAEWLKSQGYVFSDDWEECNGDLVAIIAT